MARSLVIKKFAALGATDKDKDKDPSPGCMHLYNFYKPSLEAGTYGIEVTQNVSTNYKQTPPGITTNPQTKTIRNVLKGKSTVQTQVFHVVAPQFSLDPKLIDTFYPPPGHQDEARILPHIVFNDPHVPWFRPAGNDAWMRNPIDVKATAAEQGGQNLVPWIGLVVFKHDELLVGSEEATKLGLDKVSLIGGKKYSATQQPGDGTYHMTVSTYLGLSESARIYYEADEDLKYLKSSDEPTSVIFPLKSQVAGTLGSKANTKPIEAQKLLSHVRRINTIGFPDAGVQENGYFSVVVSSMTGDVTELAPTTHIVHLVSLEHLGATDLHVDPNDKQLPTRVGLVSLFSWTYTCLPDAINFQETMKRLGNGVQSLKPPVRTLEAIKQPSALYSRLDAGYTISRWRTPTGEESAAFNRGPLVPLVNPDVPRKTGVAWPGLSMTGRDYMVLDKTLGMMDMTYASAWSTGKLMAMSDSVFNSALMRFRSRIWMSAASATLMTANGIANKDSVLSNAVVTMRNAVALTHGKFTGAPARTEVPTSQPQAPTIDHPQLAAAMEEAVRVRVHAAASTGSHLYNGLDGKGALNSDFEIIANWVFDCMYLGHMPAHLLFPEPSHLVSPNPDKVNAGQSSFIPEALRFFSIDHAWIDCFIDGALSCANHHEPDYDTVRLAIKEMINRTLNNRVGITHDLPPVPRCGLIIRSAAVKATPDLKITAHYRKLETDDHGVKKWVEDTESDPLVRHTRLDDFTILSLFSCSLDELYVVLFAQPGHQQRFAIALSDDHQPALNVKKLYTDPLLAPPHKEPGGVDVIPEDRLKWLPLHGFKSDTDFYNSSTRCINPIAIADKINSELLKWSTNLGGGYYDNTVPNSAVLGLELNDSSCKHVPTRVKVTKPADQLEIRMSDLPTSHKFPAFQRKLWAEATRPPRRKPHEPVVKQTGRGNDPIKIPIRKPSSLNDPHYNGLPPVGTQLTGTKPFAHDYPFSEPRDPTTQSQFELLIHPAYRSAPPRPRFVGDWLHSWYSPVDYIPTEEKTPFDLIFAIRRRTRALDSSLPLKGIYIEIPLYDENAAKQLLHNANDATPPLQDAKDAKHPPHEPLLASDDYSNVHVRMCQNQRFIPALFSGQASHIGYAQWDKLPVLVLALLPRSSSKGGIMTLDSHSISVSVRLTQPKIAPIVKQYGIKVQDFGDPKPVPGALAMVKMTELYEGMRPRYTWCAAVKLPGVDPEANT